MWVFIETENEFGQYYRIGFVTDNTFQTVIEVADKEKAMRVVHYLNGGGAENIEDDSGT